MEIDKNGPDQENHQDKNGLDLDIGMMVLIFASVFALVLLVVLGGFWVLHWFGCCTGKDLCWQSKSELSVPDPELETRTGFSTFYIPSELSEFRSLSDSDEFQSLLDSELCSVPDPELCSVPDPELCSMPDSKAHLAALEGQLFTKGVRACLAAKDEEWLWGTYKDS